MLNQYETRINLLISCDLKSEKSKIGYFVKEKLYVILLEEKSNLLFLLNYLKLLLIFNYLRIKT